MELEWGNDYSLTSDDYTMPATLKYTPEGRHILWGRTEFAASFDTISTAVENDAREAMSMGINATTSFLIGKSTPTGVDGELVSGALAYEILSARLKALLGESSAR